MVEGALMLIIVFAIIAAVGFAIFKTIKGFWRAVDRFALQPKSYCPKCKTYFHDIDHYVCHLTKQN